MASQYIDLPLSGGGGGVITSINGDVTPAQILNVGTSGTDFAISDNGSGTHTFNLPTASASNRGALSSANWTTFNNKLGPIGSSTDNAMVRWDGVGGNALQDGSQFTMNDTGHIVWAPSGAPTNAFYADLTGLTSITRFMYVAGTLSTNTAHGLWLNLTGSNASSKNHWVVRADLAGGTYTTSGIACVYGSMAVTNSANTIGGWTGSFQASAGALFQAQAGNTGYAPGVASFSANSKTCIAVYGAAITATAASGTPRTWGGWFLATGENSAQTIGISAKIATATSSGNEAYDAGVSAAAVFDNGDTTSDILNLKDNGTTKVKVTDLGNTVLSNAALSTSATDGFLYIPSMNGAPSGTPTSYTGTVAMVYDTANLNLYVYSGGNWAAVQLAV